MAPNISLHGPLIIYLNAVLDGWFTDFHAVRPLEEAGWGEGSVRSPERDGQVLQHLTRRTQVRTHLMSQHADLKT